MFDTGKALSDTKRYAKLNLSREGVPTIARKKH